MIGCEGRLWSYIFDGYFVELIFGLYYGMRLV